VNPAHHQSGDLAGGGLSAPPLDAPAAGRWPLGRAQLRLLRPLLVALPLLLLVSLFCLELMATSSAMLRGQARWFHAATEATQTLDLYARSCERTYLARHQAAMEVLVAFGELRAKMNETPPDFEAAVQAHQRADPNPLATDPGRRELRLRLTHLTNQLPWAAPIHAHWGQAGGLANDIHGLAVQVERHVTTHGCADAGGRQPLMAGLTAIERRLAPLMADFGDTIVNMNRRVHAVVVALLVGTAAVVLLLGAGLARRTARANRLAAQAAQAELDVRRQSIAALRRVLGTLGAAPAAGLPATVATAASVDDILQQVQRLADQQRADHAALQAIFARSPDAFVSFGPDGRVAYLSPPFETLTGLPPEAAMGCDALGLLALLGGDGQADARLLSAPADGSAARQPWQLDLPGPTPRTLEVIPLQASTEVQPKVLCLRDVTRAQALDRLKSEFMTTAAHELRTPMASIFGFVELMRTRAMSDTRRAELMDIVHRQSRRMIGILDDLLDLSRLESRGRASLKPIRLDLAALAQEVVLVHPRPEGRSAPRLVPGADAGWVLADREKLMRVLDNLVSNAYKYSPDGGEVLLQVVERRTVRGGVQFGLCVQDHGMGMTAEQLQRVGERFYRVDASGNIPGTGLGVSLVREVLQLHGGSLQMESSIGVGSRCTAWLPAAP
jgi:signal transduction histidine kinase